MMSPRTDQQEQRIRSTTILAVRRGSDVVVAGDGQVSLGQTVMKGGARKVRTLQDGKVAAGFAGSAADGLSLFERLDGKLAEHGGRLRRAAVELAKDWRTDKMLRRLEAMLIVADADGMYLLSGTGDIIEPDDDVLAIGSGGNYALSAAKALLAHTEMGAEEVCRAAMKIAADICVYTNHNIILQRVGN